MASKSFQLVGCPLVNDMTEVSNRNFQCNQKWPPSENPVTASKQSKDAETNSSNSPFVNQAAIAWEESRLRWIGNQTQRSQKLPKDPIISWSMTYGDLLSNTDPFPQRIPLPEMVDFLVDIWNDEGLYD